MAENVYRQLHQPDGDDGVGHLEASDAADSFKRKRKRKEIEQARPEPLFLIKPSKAINKLI